MLREYLSNLSLLGLPVAAMLLFLSLFVAVLWRVSRKARAPEYARMAQLPLEKPARRPVEQAVTGTAWKGGL
jgi:cbb3-type cytochrome oxidase subunit 3